jgi:hypothetical protein
LKGILSSVWRVHLGEKPFVQSGHPNLLLSDHLNRVMDFKIFSVSANDLLDERQDIASKDTRRTNQD